MYRHRSVSLNNEKFVVKLLKMELFGFELSVLESVSSRQNISDLIHAS